MRWLTGPAIVAAALLLGLATNALGPERRINLLAVPLLGLLAWNLATYAVTALAALLRSVRRDGDAPVAQRASSATPERQ